MPHTTRSAPWVEDKGTFVLSVFQQRSACSGVFQERRGWLSELLIERISERAATTTCSGVVTNLKVDGVTFGIEDRGALERRRLKHLWTRPSQVDGLGLRRAEPRLAARLLGCKCAWSGRERHGASLRGCRRIGSSCSRIGQHCCDCSGHVALLAVARGPVAVVWVSCDQVRACAVVGRVVAVVGRARGSNVARGHRVAFPKLTSVPG